MTCPHWGVSTGAAVKLFRQGRVEQTTCYRDVALKDGGGGEGGDTFGEVCDVDSGVFTLGAVQTVAWLRGLCPLLPGGCLRLGRGRPAVRVAAAARGRPTVWVAAAAAAAITVTAAAAAAVAAAAAAVAAATASTYARHRRRATQERRSNADQMGQHVCLARRRCYDWIFGVVPSQVAGHAHAAGPPWVRDLPCV